MWVSLGDINSNVWDSLSSDSVPIIVISCKLNVSLRSCFTLCFDLTGKYAISSSSSSSSLLADLYSTNGTFSWHPGICKRLIGISVEVFGLGSFKGKEKKKFIFTCSRYSQIVTEDRVTYEIRVMQFTIISFRPFHFQLQFSLQCPTRRVQRILIFHCDWRICFDNNVEIIVFVWL